MRTAAACFGAIFACASLGLIQVAGCGRTVDVDAIEYEPFVLKTKVVNGTEIEFRGYEAPDGRWRFMWEYQDIVPATRVDYFTCAVGLYRWAKISINGVECRVYGVMDSETGKFEWRGHDQEVMSADQQGGEAASNDHLWPR